jgi:hypothetical protein
MTATEAPWVVCECCEDYLCTIHGDHVADLARQSETRCSTGDLTIWKNWTTFSHRAV